jgi:hypothetical protein
MASARLGHRHWPPKQNKTVKRRSNTLKTWYFWRGVAPAEATEWQMLETTRSFSSKALNNWANLPSMAVHKGGVIRNSLLAPHRSIGGDAHRLIANLTYCNAYGVSKL